MEISFRSNIKQLERSVSDFTLKQMPFATATAITGLARDVKDAETGAIKSLFNEPRAFTKSSVGITSAKKTTLTATVFIKDIQAKYLAPEEFNEPQFLGKGRKIRTPVDIQTNASGDIPRGKIKALMARPDTFMATIGGVNGLWQRPYYRKAGARRGRSKLPKGTNTTGRLRLLVAFTRPKQVKVRFNYFERAEKIINAGFNKRFGAALAKAIATAK